MREKKIQVRACRRTRTHACAPLLLLLCAFLQQTCMCVCAFMAALLASHTLTGVCAHTYIHACKALRAHSHALGTKHGGQEAQHVPGECFFSSCTSKQNKRVLVQMCVYTCISLCSARSGFLGLSSGELDMRIHNLNACTSQARLPYIAASYARCKPGLERLKEVLLMSSHKANTRWLLGMLLQAWFEV